MRLSDPSLESDLLGTLLTTPPAVPEVLNLIRRPEVFFSEAHQQVYKAIQSLYTQSYGIDVLSVTQQLIRQTGRQTVQPVGEEQWLTLVATLAAEESAGGTPAYKALALLDIHIGRCLAADASDMLRDLAIPGTDMLTLLSKYTDRLQRYQSKLGELSNKPFKEHLLEVVRKAERAAQTGNPITGLATGLDDLDRFFRGLDRQTLTVFAGRPGMGKTAQACQIAYNVAVLGRKPVVFFSLEMSCEQLAVRFEALETGYKNPVVKSGLDRFGHPIDFTRLLEGASRVADSPLQVYDNLFTYGAIAAKCHELKAKGELELVIIDYLQLVKWGQRTKDRTEEVTEVSRALKLLSKTLNVPVLALAQLSRAVELRPSRIPQMSDLRESGAIEQDADNIFFLFRPAYYFQQTSDGFAVSDDLLLNIIVKNRNGSVHTVDPKAEFTAVEAVRLRCDLSCNRVMNWTVTAPQEPQLFENEDKPPF